MSAKGLNQLKNRARREEQRENWSRAIELYTQALDASRQKGEAFADLSLYNRIGDIYLRIGQKNTAVRYYEQAIEGYAEQELHTSAIALCNKVLRVVPGKTSIFLQLGRLHLATNLIADARDYFHRFAIETRARGDVEAALAALEALLAETGDAKTWKLWISWLAEEDPEFAEERIGNLGDDLARHGIDAAEVIAYVREGGDPGWGDGKEAEEAGVPAAADPLAGALLTSDESSEARLPLLDDPGPTAEEEGEEEDVEAGTPAVAGAGALSPAERGSAEGSARDESDRAGAPADERPDALVAAGTESSATQAGSKPPDEEETEGGQTEETGSLEPAVEPRPWDPDESEAEAGPSADEEAPALPAADGREDVGPDLALVADGSPRPEKDEPADPPTRRGRRARAWREGPERPVRRLGVARSKRPDREALEIAASAVDLPADDVGAGAEANEASAPWSADGRGAEIALEDSEDAEVWVARSGAEGGAVADEPCEPLGPSDRARAEPPFESEEQERVASGRAGLEDLVESARTLAAEPPVSPDLGDGESDTAGPGEQEWLPAANGGRQRDRRWFGRGRPGPEPAETDEAAPVEGAEPLERAAVPDPPHAARPDPDGAEGREVAPGAEEALAEGLALREAGRYAEAIEHLERAQLSPAHFAQAYEALEACREALAASGADDAGGDASGPEPVALDPGPEPVALDPGPEPVALEPEPEPMTPEPEPEPMAPEPEPLAEARPSSGSVPPVAPVEAREAPAWELADEEQESEEAFGEWVESAPPAVLRRALSELEARSELGKASLVLRRLVDLGDTDPDLHRKRLDYAERRDDRIQAIEAHLDLGASLEQAGRAAEARRTYERLLEVDPANGAAIDALERLEGRRPDPEEEGSDSIRPTATMRESMLTDRPLHTGGTASRSFGPGPLDLDAETGRPRPYSGVAGGREAATDFEQLLNEFRAQLHDRPRESDTVTRTELGASLKDMGRLDDAIRELQAAVREPHAPPLAFELLGEAFLEKGQARVAVRLLEEALEESVRGDREMLGVLYQLGVALERLGEHQNALGCYERVFSIDIDYRDVQERIASCSR